jgi:peptide/nickel transport system ATP-binding protein
MTAALIDVADLHVRFAGGERVVHAVNGIDLTLGRGEVLGILGESGSGKSVTLRTMMRLLPREARVTGTVTVEGRDILRCGDRDLRSLRGSRIAMVFQEPMTALDPSFTIGYQIAEPIVSHEGISWSSAYARARTMLDLVQVPSADRRLKAYPHELSGGLRQRAMIAIALGCRPAILLADEPTTALDATVQIQILLLLRSLQRELGMGVVFVTHDVGAAAEIADRLAVMYAGRIVESGPVADVLQRPLHPYTEGLLGSTVHGDRRLNPVRALTGAPPSLQAPLTQCGFADRCVHARAPCRAAIPGPVLFAPGRRVECVRLSDIRRGDVATG